MMEVVGQVVSRCPWSPVSGNKARQEYKAVRPHTRPMFNMDRKKTSVSASSIGRQWNINISNPVLLPRVLALLISKAIIFVWSISAVGRCLLWRHSHTHTGADLHYLLLTTAGIQPLPTHSSDGVRDPWGGSRISPPPGSCWSHSGHLTHNIRAES